MTKITWSPRGSAREIPRKGDSATFSGEAGVSELPAAIADLP
jgi:hypothetical protein